MTKKLRKRDEKVLIELHDASMSKNPEIACKGRVAKEFLPVLIRLSESEEARGNDLGTFVIGLASCFAGLLVSSFADKIDCLTEGDLMVESLVNAMRAEMHAVLNMHKKDQKRAARR
jgi:hypothetical protein